MSAPTAPPLGTGFRIDREVRSHPRTGEPVEFWVVRREADGQFAGEYRTEASAKLRARELDRGRRERLGEPIHVTARTLANAGPCRICRAKSGEECVSESTGSSLGSAVHGFGERWGRR